MANLYKSLNIPSSVLLEGDVKQSLADCITEYKKGASADKTLTASAYALGENEKEHFTYIGGDTIIDLNTFYKSGIFHVRAGNGTTTGHINSPFDAGYGFTLIMDTNESNSTDNKLKTQIAIGGEKLDGINPLTGEATGDGRNQIWIRNSSADGATWRDWVCVAAPWTFPLIVLDPVNGDDNSRDYYSVDGTGAPNGTPIKTLAKLGQLLYYSSLFNTKKKIRIIFKTGLYEFDDTIGFDGLICDVEFESGVTLTSKTSGKNINFTNSFVNITNKGTTTVNTPGADSFALSGSKVSVNGGKIVFNCGGSGVTLDRSSMVWYSSADFSSTKANSCLFYSGSEGHLTIRGGAATFAKLGSNAQTFLYVEFGGYACLYNVTIPNSFNVGLSVASNGNIEYYNVTNNVAGNNGYVQTTGGRFTYGDTGWVSITNGATPAVDYGVKVRRVGNMVTMVADGSKSTTFAASTEGKVAQLPDWAKPDYQMVSTYRGYGGNIFTARTNTDGGVMYHSVNANPAVTITTTYIVSERQRVTTFNSPFGGESPFGGGTEPDDNND